MNFAVTSWQDEPIDSFQKYNLKIEAVKFNVVKTKMQENSME